MPKIITARELIERSPTTVDVVVEAWKATVRLRRLDVSKKLDFSLRSQRMARDENGRVLITDPANWSLAVDLLADSIIDDQGTLQFREPSQLEWLSTELEAISELLSYALRLNGLLGNEPEQEEIAEAKKD